MLRNHRQATKYYQEAIAIYQEVGDSLGEISSMLNIGKIYAKTKRKKLALSYYHNALDLAKIIASESLVKKAQECMDAL
jgi:tetratricopeptide (TPR) repeat protein